MTAGIRPLAGLGLDATAGWRTEQDASQATADRAVSWIGLDLDAALGRSIYLLVSASRERGLSAAGDQVYAGLSYRF